MTEPVTVEQLKPCPFCGGDAETYGPYGWYQQWCITHNCPTFHNGGSEAFKGYPNEAYAITAWNTRFDTERNATLERENAAQEWQPIETFAEPTALSSGEGVLVACADGTVGEAYYRNFDDEDAGWWWANTSWGDYPESGRPILPTHWMPLPEPPARNALGGQP
jgi:hypothetical protein